MPRGDSHTIRVLKTENRRLTREVARLKKSLGRYQNIDTVDDDDEPVPEPPGCPSCGSTREPSRLTTPAGKTVTVCVECKHRS